MRFGLGGLLTGVIVALSIWVFDIENPNLIAGLALFIGAVVSSYGLIACGSWYGYRGTGGGGTGGGGGKTVGQRDAD